MQTSKSKLTLYVAISASIILLFWLGTLKYSIRYELKNKDRDNLFKDIKISLDEAWAEKPDFNLNFAAPTSTDLQGGPKLSKEQLEELITNLDIKTTTTTDATQTEINLEIKN